MNKILFMFAVMSSLAPAVNASTARADVLQIQANKDTEVLKQEVIHRAEINLYPVFGIPGRLMTETVSGIQSLNVDEWTRTFESEGDKFFAKAKSEEASDSVSALADYQMAQRFYYMGRWPSVRTESCAESYRKERLAFAAVERLRGIRMEEVPYSGSGYEVIGLLVMPKDSSGKVPLVISIGGLDGWKEARISQLEPRSITV